MTWIRAARAVSGVLTIGVLLALVAAEAVLEGVAITPARVALLLTMTSALLGVDMAAERLPVRVEVGARDDDGGGDGDR